MKAGANRDGFLAPLDDRAANHLRPGLALPQGSLSATDGPEVCLAALTGRSVLIVYPWTGRPGLPNPPLTGT